MFGGHAQALSGCCAGFASVSVWNVRVGCWIFRAVNAATRTETALTASPIAGDSRPIIGLHDRHMSGRESANARPSGVACGVLFPYRPRPQPPPHAHRRDVL